MAIPLDIYQLTKLEGFANSSNKMVKASFGGVTLLYELDSMVKGYLCFL
jgi:hypothetical protein